MASYLVVYVSRFNTVDIAFVSWRADGNMGLASGNKKKSGHELLEDDDDDDAFSLVSAAPLVSSHFLSAMYYPANLSGSTQDHLHPP